jgi:uncharacterized membrane protein (UPF0127 family)
MSPCARTVATVQRETWVDARARRWIVEIPRRRCERARGLLGRSNLAVDRALFLERARSVHTFGMRFDIDAVLLDASLTVVRVVRMRPGRLLRPRPRVRHVLETTAGAGVRVGDAFVPADAQAIQLTPVVPVTVQPSGDASSR